MNLAQVGLNTVLRHYHQDKTPPTQDIREQMQSRVSRDTPLHVHNCWMEAPGLTDYCQ